ncbi:MAG TPA: UrcA family protein [Sphingomicrobium sp.]|nr:UrcA family protein [Sphingomicrobium sp.]
MLKPLPAIAAITLAAALVIPTVTQAAEENSTRVSYADLNLATGIGQTALQRRIAFAAEMVCGSADPRDLVYWQAVGNCRTDTIADAQPAYEAAVAQALHPSVTVLEATALVVTAH